MKYTSNANWDINGKGTISNGFTLELKNTSSKPWRVVIEINPGQEVFSFEIRKRDKDGKTRNYRYNYNPHRYNTTLPEDDNLVEGDPHLDLLREIFGQRIAWAAWPGWHINDSGGIGQADRSLPEGTSFGLDVPHLLKNILKDIEELPQTPSPNAE